MENNETKGNKRKTLSLKSTVGVSAPKTSSGGKTIEVEIKRKKRGLTIDLEEKSQLPSGNSALSSEPAESKTGKLTDEEFKARVKALQEAIKDEEIQKQEDPVVQEVEPVVIVTENITQEAGNVEVTPDSEPVDEVQESSTEKKPRRQLPKKKDQYVPSANPVVFRSSDYQKPKATPKKQPQVSDVQPIASRELPDIPLQDRQPTQHNKQRERPLDDSDSPKKMRLVVKTRNSDRRSQNSGKMSRAMLDRVMDDDMEERSRSMASLKRARQKLKNVGKPQEVSKVIRDVEIPDMITVGELANRMAVRSADVVKYLMSIGTMATINQSIDGDTAEIVCTEFGHRPKRVSDADIENELINVVDDPKDLSPRAPIVAVMGHRLKQKMGEK